MANTTEWTTGHRRVHHHQRSGVVQRLIALLWRDHHTEDLHTQEGPYAVHDEAFTRLDMLERPSAAKRLAWHRTMAKARAIRREANREANWVVHSGKDVHYRHPDSGGEADDSGYSLRDEDEARIGPTADDVRLEAEHRIDDMRPRLDELNADALVGRFGTPQINRIRERRAAIARERTRAALLVSTAIPDDYFEPAYWVPGHTDDLRNHMRQAIMGDEGESPSPWHVLARDAIAASSDDEDLIAVPTLVGTASETTGGGIYIEQPSDDFPDVEVAATGNDVRISFAGTLPEGVTIIATAVVVEGTVVRYNDSHRLTGSGRGFATSGTGRCAVLVQFDKVVARKSLGRTLGSIFVVDVG